MHEGYQHHRIRRGDPAGITELFEDNVIRDRSQADMREKHGALRQFGVFFNVDHIRIVGQSP